MDDLYMKSYMDFSKNPSSEFKMADGRHFEF